MCPYVYLCTKSTVKNHVSLKKVCTFQLMGSYTYGVEEIPVAI